MPTFDLTFMLHRIQSSEKRTITQFHYTVWPDHGTPEELGLVQFHRAVTKSYQPEGLMLVHCRCALVLICIKAILCKIP